MLSWRPFPPLEVTACVPSSPPRASQWSRTWGSQPKWRKFDRPKLKTWSEKKTWKRNQGNSDLEIGGRVSHLNEMKHCLNDQFDLRPFFKLVLKGISHWYFVNEAVCSDSDKSKYQIKIAKNLGNQHFIIWNGHPGSMRNSVTAASSWQPVGFQVKPVRGGKQIRFGAGGRTAVSSYCRKIQCGNREPLINEDIYTYIYLVAIKGGWRSKHIGNTKLTTIHTAQIIKFQMTMSMTINFALT